MMDVSVYHGSIPLAVLPLIGLKLIHMDLANMRCVCVCLDLFQCIFPIRSIACVLGRPSRDTGLEVITMDLARMHSFVMHCCKWIDTPEVLVYFH